MPFSQTVRDQALVAAARHCCVCHRYKGVKVEVHHIVHESKGGTNDPSNAITLCFDCHADAGHYNPDHPRGTRFSPRELRIHRDNWHSIVLSQRVAAPTEPDFMYCRFLLCKSFDAIREITLGDLSNVPVSQPMLVQNSVLEFQKMIVQAHPVSYRHDKEWGDSFPNIEAYSERYPTVQIHNRSEMSGYPYFEAIRAPSIDELQSKLAPKDGVTRLLIEAGVAPASISQVLAYHERCGADSFQEIYRLRPLWCLYLGATNLTSNPLQLRGIVCEKYEPAGLAYRDFYPSVGTDHTSTVHGLPLAALPAGATLLFPVATMLGPMECIGFESTFQETADIPSGQVQTFSHEDLSPAQAVTSLIGPVMWPKSIDVRVNSIQVEQQIHDFNLKSLYTINRYWEMGSCPHIFFLGQETILPEYYGELFAKQPGESHQEIIIIPSGIDTVLIVELEPEQTIIEEISINKSLYRTMVRLNQGDALSIPVKSGDLIDLKGHYISKSTAATDPWFRNALVHGFILEGAGLKSHSIQS